MLEVKMQSTETGRVWDEIIHSTDLPEVELKCKLHGIKIISIFPACNPEA
jgi:hypothetical protein